MPLVVDSSVAACWAMPDEFSQAADRALDLLSGDTMLVPSVFWYEIRNVLLVNERRQRIPASHGRAALQKIDEIPRIEDLSPVSDDVLSLARRHGLTVYDAAYLELALRRAASLATLDTKLSSAAASEGVEVVA